MLWARATHLKVVPHNWLKSFEGVSNVVNEKFSPSAWRNGRLAVFRDGVWQKGGDFSLSVLSCPFLLVVSPFAYILGFSFICLLHWEKKY